MNTYKIGNQTVDSVELKCLLVSRGVKCDKTVYRRFGGEYRLNVNPLTCNCLILPDGTICQMTDVGFHLQYLNGALSWDNLKLLRYASELGTPFSVKLADGKAALFYEKEFVDFVTFPPYTDFYKRRTSGGLPFAGNAVLQGLDWVAFQCLWHCEFAAAGKPCEFCFSGAEFEANAKRGKAQPQAVSASDVAEITRCAFEQTSASSIQITGGSTFDGETESRHIRAYLRALADVPRSGELLLYITPPSDTSLIDEYFALGASRIACSLEVWDAETARKVTPGKMDFTTRERHLRQLEYIAGRHGAGKAFSNFIIGLEPLETLKQGASYLAERGIIPTASVWMPMGRPVRGSMKAPGVDFYRAAKEMFAELYSRHKLDPAGACGLNVCVERDIFTRCCGAADTEC
ncbi:MAG: hypothetical protein LBS90_03275 [Oscillospiraceae bacterium]|jgi:hypothetical protein|nr:hypothetical protein [Oscillospiraceae bacterium]